MKLSHSKLEVIKLAIDYFNSGKATKLIKTGGLEFFESSRHPLFFGVNKHLQKNLDFQIVREQIFEMLGLPQKSIIIQVIGDCTRFSQEGTIYARSFLEKHLIKHENLLVLWGYTGQREIEKSADVNQLVNNWFDSNQIHSHKGLANIVDLHTIKAIREWNCSIPYNNCNFFLVYGDALFGDDIISSDNLTDISIVLEGGVQTFRQIVNLLSAGRSIYGVYNLRSATNYEYYDEKTGKYLKYFSAVEFLDLLKNEIKMNYKSPDLLSTNDIDDYLLFYLTNRQLYNTNRPESITKNALFSSAWSQFVSERLWNSLHKCNFEKFNYNA